MKKLINYGLPFLFLICFIAVLLSAAWARPRVFVVMSYTSDNLWEQQVRDGIDKTFKTKAPYYSINYFYLNTLNNTPADIHRSIKSATRLISILHPQVLITVDDDAQKFIGVRYLNQKNISLVFSGVNADPAIYGYKPKENVTGVIENLHYNAMKQAILTMFPQYHQITHLCDNSNTSQHVQQQVMDYNWQPLKIVNSYKTDSLQEWLTIVKQANAKHALLLLTHFGTIHDGNQLVSPEKVIQLTLEQAHVPILDFFDFTVKDGVPMALSTSGLEQGQTAAELTMRIINNKEKAGDIPFAHSNYITFATNQNSIDINMPNVIIPQVYRSLAYLNSASSYNSK
jgi:ABC-type uncharacterized transport system substrate-binding protein